LLKTDCRETDRQGHTSKNVAQLPQTTGECCKKWKPLKFVLDSLEDGTLNCNLDAHWIVTYQKPCPFYFRVWWKSKTHLPTVESLGGGGTGVETQLRLPELASITNIHGKSAQCLGRTHQNHRGIT
jgi:hypothetical protein